MKESAYDFYYLQLQLYVKAGQSVNIDELKGLLNDVQMGVITQDLEQSLEVIRARCKDKIIGYSHPEVWEEMKQQKGKSPKLKSLFESASEALAWSNEGIKL